MRGLSLVAASGGHSSSRCVGLSLSRPLLSRSTSSRRAGSVAVAHGPSCSVACGIFPDQGSNTCPLHWQADSQPLRHQGSPIFLFLIIIFYFNNFPLSSFLPFFPSFFPSVFPSFLPSFLLSFLLSFFPSFLPSLLLPSFLPSFPSFLPSFSFFF